MLENRPRALCAPQKSKFPSYKKVHGNFRIDPIEKEVEEGVPAFI